MKKIKLNRELAWDLQGRLVPQNIRQLAKEVVSRAIRKKYTDKPSEYHNLQSLIYWNEALF